MLLRNCEGMNYDVLNCSCLRPSKESTVKVKALNETILRLNENNQRLMTENKTLKEDLQKALDDTAVPKSARMSRLCLIIAINRID